MITASIGRDRYRTEINTGNHSILADEPSNTGGTDIAPAPQEYVQVGLASCTVITLRMYADKKNLPVERITAEVQAERSGNLTIFNMSIHIEGDLTDDQRSRMLQIAESCPVHRQLTQPIEIKTRFA